MYSYEYIDNYLDILKNCEHDEYELIKSKMSSNEYIDNYAINAFVFIIKINTKALKYQLIYNIMNTNELYIRKN